MSDYTVYHNPRCSKSRNALTYLEEKNADFEIVDYLKTPFTKEDLKAVLKMLRIPAKDLIRTREDEFKENFHGKELSENEWISAMLKYPKLIERPIVVRNGKAVIARPTEAIDQLG